MKTIWLKINELRHDLGNEKIELKMLIEDARKTRTRVNRIEKKLFKLIEKVEKLEG